MDTDRPTPDIDDIPSACAPPAVEPALVGRPLGPTPWRMTEAPPEKHGVLTAAAPDDKAAIARQICDVMRLMYQQEVVVANDGNVSARLPNGNILITASGVLKGFMTPDQVIECDPEGNALDGRRVTTEVKMHVAAYKMRPDIRAVVHGHPIYAVAFSIAGLSLEDCNIPEIIVTMGTIPTAPYATPGTYDLPDSIARYIRNSDAVIMERHGVVCVGSDLFDAFKKMEMVEHTAKIMHAAHTLGGPIKPLDRAEVQALLDSRKDLGIATTNTLCWSCGADQTCEAPGDPGHGPRPRG